MAFAVLQCFVHLCKIVKTSNSPTQINRIYVVGASVGLMLGVPAYLNTGSDSPVLQFVVFYRVVNELMLCCKDYLVAMQVKCSTLLLV